MRANNQHINNVDIRIQDILACCKVDMSPGTKDFISRKNSSPHAVDQAFLPQKLGILGILGILGMLGMLGILSPFWAGSFNPKARLFIAICYMCIEVETHLIGSERLVQRLIKKEKLKTFNFLYDKFANN